MTQEYCIYKINMKRGGDFWHTPAGWKEMCKLQAEFVKLGTKGMLRINFFFLSNSKEK